MPTPHKAATTKAAARAADTEGHGKFKAAGSNKAKKAAPRVADTEGHAVTHHKAPTHKR